MKRPTSAQISGTVLALAILIGAGYWVGVVASPIHRSLDERVRYLVQEIQQAKTTQADKKLPKPVYNNLQGKITFNDPYQVTCNGQSYYIWLVEAGTFDNGQKYVGLYEGYHGQSLEFNKRAAPGAFTTACHRFVVVPANNGDMFMVKVYGQ